MRQSAKQEALISAVEILTKRVDNLEKVVQRDSPIREHLVSKGLDPDMVRPHGTGDKTEIFLSEKWYKQTADAREKEYFTEYNLALREIGFVYVPKSDYDEPPGHWVRKSVNPDTTSEP